MSFADELRGIASMKDQADRSAASTQAEQAWPHFLELFYNDLKGRCVQSARNGHHEAASTLSHMILDGDDLYDAAGVTRRPTQEEWEVINALRCICRFNRFPLRYIQDLNRQITKRFEAEGLQVRSLPYAPDKDDFSDIDFTVRW